ncbi:tyrosine--tRNA ligase [Limnochorda pilosa]|uniref:Tyrosine--tRNA ligase n=1 Tax=Limnochorda pilosa TaxID=1555112 RepID=A0A0K2SMI5_LIMPI|nr:tyrosine--tRNA ligase [Limnochorda pilosa]BAS28326.1 tyrosyl-tRNA synthetase [Limnochorda pilosa]
MDPTHTGAEQALEAIRRGAEEIFPEGELLEKLRQSQREGRPLRVKLGIDPTASDLHLGHMIPVLKMKVFQDLGHQAVIIIGDYTATVGDPSGRNEARPQLSHEQVLENARDYTRRIFGLLDPERTEITWNGHWFSSMTFSEVMWLLSQMTLARMLEREDFSRRFKGQLPISLHEMVYPLMQGYDSVMVRADVELGGIDQKFNIAVGRDLQRVRGLPPQVGVCNPLLLGTDGHEKMSKSLGNTIPWDAPPEEKFGKLMSIPDELTWPYLELLTLLPLSDLAAWRSAVERGDLHPKEAKKRLAREVVRLLHGAEAATRAEEHFDQVITRREAPADMAEVLVVASEAPEGEMWPVALLVQAGLAASNSEARRLIAQGAVRLDGEPVADTDRNVTVRDGAVLQVGRRRFARLRRQADSGPRPRSIP